MFILTAKKWRTPLVATVATGALASATAAYTFGGRVGNAIFIHPDGSALNHWDAARMF